MIQSTAATTSRRVTETIARQGGDAVARLAPSVVGRRNVSNAERIASAAVGGALTVFGMRSKAPLGVLAVAAGAALVYRGMSGWCPGYAAMGIDTARPVAGREGAAPVDYFRRAIRLEETATIQRLPWDLYQFWRNFEHLPQFMNHLESVQTIDDRRSRWVAKGPGGTRIQWDAEIINDEPNSLIAWRSLDQADVDNAGSVRFVPSADGTGTEVKVVMDYIPPSGRLGAAVAQLLGHDPAAQVREDLQRFKTLMETGQVELNNG